MEERKLNRETILTMPIEEVERLLREIMERLDEERELAAQRRLAPDRIVGRS